MGVDERVELRDACHSAQCKDGMSRIPSLSSPPALAAPFFANKLPDPKLLETRSNAMIVPPLSIDPRALSKDPQSRRRSTGISSRALHDVVSTSNRF
jgi:hypothetical protein